MGMFLKYMVVVLFFTMAGKCLSAVPEVKANHFSVSGKQTVAVSVSSAVPDAMAIYLFLKDVCVPEVQMDIQDHSHFMTPCVGELCPGSMWNGTGTEQTVCSGKFRDYLSVRHLHGFYVLFLKKLIV